jgi:predicted porin
MKKTLVAVAALAFVGAAFAQSTVTLYGRIDASVANNKTTTTTPAGIGTVTDGGTLIQSGANTGSRWGLKGTEDLGGGLSALFQIESGFAVDTGASGQGGLLFGRQAYAGLSGGFGTITLGRQYDIIDNGYKYDPAGYGGYGSMNYVFNSAVNFNAAGVATGLATGFTGCATGLAPGIAVGTGDCRGRQNNSVMYSTPNISGFSGSVMYAPGENKVPGVSGAGRVYGLLGGYDNGPMSFSAAWQSSKVIGGSAATTNYAIGGSYDFTVVKAFLQFEGGNNKTNAEKDNGYEIGLSAPVGAATLLASYAHENEKVGGVRFASVKGYHLEAKYPLSKRTYVYAAYLNGKNNASAASGLSSVKQQNYGLGLVHNF